MTTTSLLDTQRHADRTIDRNDTPTPRTIVVHSTFARMMIREHESFGKSDLLMRILS